MTTHAQGPIEIGPWESTTLREGSDRDATVILVHGFMGSPNDWRGVSDRLPGVHAVGLTVPAVLTDDDPIAPMPPGGVEVAADALASWLIEHEYADAHLCGYSMGARILLSTIARHREIQPRSLSLLAGNPGIADTERPARLVWDMNNARQLLETGLDAFLTDWYQNSVFSSVHDKPDTLRALIESKTGHSPEQLARQIIAYSPARMANYWLTLPKLTRPTLLLAGEHDAKYVHICKHAAYEMPHATARIIPDAGHTLLAESPGVVAAALAEFLSEHGRS